MGQHRPFRVARRAGGVGEQHNILGRALFDRPLHIALVGGAERAAGCLHLVERFEEVQVVIADPARVVVDDQLEMRQPLAQRQDLVDLLLVLGDHDPGLRMVEDISQFGRDRILVDRHCDAAEALRRQLCPIEPRPVVADDR